MWNLKKGNEFLSYVSVERLKKLYDREQNAKAKLRLLAAIRRKKGESLDEIATALEKPRRTIHGWLQRFEERKLKAVHDKKQPGRPSKLTLSQLKQLRRELIKGPAHVPGRLWTNRLVNEHLEKRYGLRYERKYVTVVLHKLGFSVQKPRQQHYKADKTTQEQFKKKQNASPTTIAVMAGRSPVWTSAQSTSRPTLPEDGR